LTLFTSPDGVHRWVWCAYGEEGLWALCVETDGWFCTAVDDAPSRNEVAGMLTALSPEDRVALLAEFAKNK